MSDAGPTWSMQPEPERQDNPTVFKGSDRLVALEGHLLCIE